MSPFRKLAQLLRPHTALVVFAVGSSLATTAALLTFPILTRSILGGIGTSAGADDRMPAIVETALLAFVLIASSYAAYSSMFSASRRIIADLRITYSGHLLSLPVSFFRERSGGDLVDRFSKNISEIEWFFRYIFLTSIILGFLFIGAIGMLLVISWKLTLLLLAITAVSILLIDNLLKRTKHAVAREESLSGKRSSRLQELISGIELVKAFGAEQREIARLRAEEETGRPADRIFAFLEPVMFTVAIVALLALMIAGGYLIAAGELTLSDFVAFLMYTLMLVPQSRTFSLILMRWQQFPSSLERIEEILRIPGENNGSKSKSTLRGSDGSIRLDTVSVVYPNGTRALNDVSLSFADKEAVGIVGQSGAGKTTLFNLLLGFCERSGGKISLGGIDVSAYDTAAVRRMFAIVPQDPFLFNATLTENLRYGRPAATEAEIIEACRISHAEEFIVRLPDSFGTIVGERGGLLSAGQRQRIALARALLSEAPVLLMDEATSSLDSHTEHEIQAALNEIIHRRTVLIIAHRLATVVHLPRIVVFDNGTVIDDGTHVELLDRCPAYRRLVTTQFISMDQPVSTPAAAL